MLPCVIICKYPVGGGKGMSYDFDINDFARYVQAFGIYLFQQSENS